MEEGKCSQRSEGTSGEELSQVTLVEEESTVVNQIDDKIRSSMSQVQNYFEKKFEDISKVFELQKQLEENKKQLEVLKAKGMTCELGIRVDAGENDSHSEVTIYRNVIEQKRDSSSSDEVDFIDETSVTEKQLRVNIPDKETEVSG